MKFVLALGVRLECLYKGSNQGNEDQLFATRDWLNDQRSHISV